jgi:hypothetical protein
MGTGPAIAVDVFVIMAPHSMWVRTFGQDRGSVFRVRFIDEEPRRPRERERVGATGVVSCDH